MPIHRKPWRSWISEVTVDCESPSSTLSRSMRISVSPAERRWLREAGASGESCAAAPEAESKNAVSTTSPDAGRRNAKRGMWWEGWQPQT